MEIEVGPVSELRPGSVRVVTDGDRQVAVFSTAEGLYALDSACAHKRGPLGEGWVDRGVVTCPWHWWRYELSTGRRLGSETIAVSTHPVTIRDGMVVVEVPEPLEAPVTLRQRLLELAREWEGRR